MNEAVKSIQSVILELRSASPGDEGARATDELFRVYRNYVEGLGWEVEILDAEPVLDAGFRFVVASINGNGVFGFLDLEAGLHRIQRRVQPGDRSRVVSLLIHADVLAQPGHVELAIADVDLSVGNIRLARPGPGNEDGADSVCKVVHHPTGIEVRQRNDAAHYGASERAMKILRARVFRQQRSSPASRTLPSITEGGDQTRPIRTYNIPQGRISDRRGDIDLWNLEDVLSDTSLAMIIAKVNSSLPGREV
jgi:peptide chain release factor 1